MWRRSRAACLALCAAILATSRAGSDPQEQPAPGQQAGEYLRANFTKREMLIPMRDGASLYTVAYVPKAAGKHPILLERTPYGLEPYGAEAFPAPVGGPMYHYARSGFIFAFQDVRGRHRSAGQFAHMRPYEARKPGPRIVDESTDAYDTIDWLVKQLPGNNERVAMLGLSYAGFYSAMGAIDPHPALRCISPQAPAMDWYGGDDFRRNGAFQLLHAYRFFSSFGGQPDDIAPDAYDFFLRAGSLAALDARRFATREPFWRELITRDSDQPFWRERRVARHLRDARLQMLIVGGWHDAENLHGALDLYRNAGRGGGSSASLVMGPWAHSEWSWKDGSRLGALDFDAPTAHQYRERIERPFLDHCLRGEGTAPLPGAYVFETGANRWRSFPQWPPPHTSRTAMHFLPGGGLGFSPPREARATYDEFVSDPAHPVPFVPYATTRMPVEYMVDDQRFAATRPDVLVYRSAVLESDVTLAGPIEVRLRVSTSGTDADWVVKLIDVHPADAASQMAGYQQLVRGEPMRGRYREGFDAPRAFVPGEPAVLDFVMPDVFHTFRRGHRIMVQVQGSWFPLMDRNPQTFVPLHTARPEDYRVATHRLFHSGPHASALIVNVLEAER